MNVIFGTILYIIGAIVFANITYKVGWYKTRYSRVQSEEDQMSDAVITSVFWPVLLPIVIVALILRLIRKLYDKH